MSNSKKWSICCLVFALVILTAAGAMTTVIDPFFHYHAPLDGLQYPIDNQRYQNDGIVKHFSYDALITGTSMTENFKTSEFDTLFGVNSSLVLDVPLMLFVMAFLTLPALKTKKLSRYQGIVLLILYAAFCGIQFTM